KIKGVAQVGKCPLPEPELGDVNAVEHGYLTLQVSLRGKVLCKLFLLARALHLPECKNRQNDCRGEPEQGSESRLSTCSGELARLVQLALLCQPGDLTLLDRLHGLLVRFGRCGGERHHLLKRYYLPLSPAALHRLLVQCGRNLILGPPFRQSVTPDQRNFA